MNGSHHIDLTLSVAQAMGFTNAKLIAEFADFPDRVDDIAVKGIGTSIFGKKLCSLTHFQIKTGTATRIHPAPPIKEDLFRGYGWKLDDSVPHLDLPNVKTACLPDTWAGIVDETWIDQHPLKQLLAVRGYTKYADEITYPDGGSMAQWLSMSKRSSALIGSSVHFVQDACVFQHVRGWLLVNHAAYESCIQDLWFSKKDGKRIKAMLKKYAAGKKTCTPRRAVEEAAVWTSEWMNCAVPVSADNFFSLTETAISYTAQVLRWWRDVR